MSEGSRGFQFVVPVVDSGFKNLLLANCSYEKFQATAVTKLTARSMTSLCKYIDVFLVKSSAL